MLATLLGKARDKGLRESLALGRDIVGARVTARHRTDRLRLHLTAHEHERRPARCWCKSSRSSRTGMGSGSLRLLTPNIHPILQEQVERRGATVERAAAVLGPTLVRVQLSLRFHDFVLLNTVAAPSNYRAHVFHALKRGQIARANWYIHEDIEQLPLAAPFMLDPRARGAISDLVEGGKLMIYVPSKLMKTQYDDLLKTNQTKILPYASEVGDAFYQRRRQ